MQFRTDVMVKPLFLMCALVAGCGGGSVNDSHSGHAHNHGIAEIEPGVWPPTLANIENEQKLPPSTRTRGSDIIIATARESVLNNPAIRSLLGNNYAEFESSVADKKSGNVATFQFYNYNENKTIEAVMASDGSITHDLYTSEQYQPTENSDEVTQAISLAAAAFDNDGIDITALTGTAMLAYKPVASNQDATASSQYYPERMLYVTFGAGNGLEPEYRALVNLSQQSVIDSGEIQ